MAVQEGRLAATLDRFHERYSFPGATAAIALPDGTVVTAATGLADAETGRAMTPETPVLVASIGNGFVVAPALALASEGRLSLDDLLSVHLGDRPRFEALPNACTTTIDRLLHQTAGLPDHVHLSAFQQAWGGPVSGPTFDPQDLIGFVTGRAPLFGAGTAWACSDTGHVLPGLVIEKVTGQPWQDAVRVRFLDPFAMHGTFPSDRPDLPGLAVGHVAADNPFGMPERTADADRRFPWNPAVESAGGGLASTSADLARRGHLPFGEKAMSPPYLDRLPEYAVAGHGAPLMAT